MHVMADKRPKGEAAIPESVDDATVPVSARISSKLAKVLKRHVDTVRPRSNNSAVIELALEQYFAGLGQWPPAEPQKPAEHRTRGKP